MNAIAKIHDLPEEAAEKLQQDLIQYCALDTLAVVKIIKKLYEVMKEQEEGDGKEVQKAHGCVADGTC